MRKVRLLLVITVFLILIALGLGVFLLTYQFEESNCYLVENSDIYINPEDGYHTIDLGDFSIRTPQSFKFASCRGIDSFVGMITNGKDTLYFDYGGYSAGPDGLDADKQLLAKDTIQGKIAYLTRPQKTGNGITGIFIRKAYNENRLSMTGVNVENEDLILKMFESLTFPDSDPRMVAKEFATDFKPVDFAPGQLLKQSCFACHKLQGQLIGPGLSEIDSSSFFIYFNGEIINDPGKKADSTANGQEWHQRSYQNLSPDKLAELFEYIQE